MQKSCLFWSLTKTKKKKKASGVVVCYLVSSFNNMITYGGKYDQKLTSKPQQ